MGISLVQNLGGALGSTGATSYQSTAFSANPTVGNTLILEAALFTGSSITAADITITDTAGNTWKVDTFVEYVSPTAGNYEHSITASAPITASGASFKVTLACTVAQYTFFTINEWAVSGGGTLVKDVSATATQPLNTTSIAAAIGAALASTGELLVGVMAAMGGNTAAGISTPASITGPTLSTAAASLGVSQNASATNGGEFTYAIASSTAAPTATWAYSADTASYAGETASITAYKVGASGTAYTLATAAGYFNLIGGAATKDLAIDAGHSSFGLTGYPATFTYTPATGTTYTLVAAQGSYSLIGKAATKQASVGASKGNFSLTGLAATLSWSGAPSGLVDNGTYRKLQIFELSSVAGLRRWVDYIPVQFFNTTSAAEADRFDREGAITVKVLTSTSGLRSWVDYIPVFVTTGPASGRWRYDDDGFLPLVQVT